MNSSGNPLRWRLDPPDPDVHTNVVNLVSKAVRYFLAADGYSTTNTAAELNAVRAAFGQWQSIPGTVWKFEDAGTRATQLTQQATIEGEQAQNYLSEVAELERTIPQGMQRLAETIEQFALGSALGRWLCLF